MQHNGFHKPNPGPQVQYFKPVVIDTCNGHPVIILNADTLFNRLTFGLKKAWLFINNWDKLADAVSGPMADDCSLTLDGKTVTLRPDQCTLVLNHFTDIINFISAEEGQVT